jgi:5-methyltetrahydrofolate--homocysteine methyltransferase
MSVKDIFAKVLEFDEEQVPGLVEKELTAGTDIQAILNDGLISAMDEVGRQFSAGDLFVPEMLMAAQAMKAGLEVLKPHLGSEGGRDKGTVIIGTVKGDLHDIGKNLVSMMMEGAGFKVVDLGVDVDADTFLKSALESKADIVAMSALLTTTMPAMEATTALFKQKAAQIKVIVGGAPVTEDFARKIGADGYSDDAPSAVELSRRLLAGGAAQAA